MGRTYVLHYHPLSLRHWLHEHQRLVRSGCALIVAMLAVAVATPTASMVMEAVAEHTASFTKGSEAVPTTTLPREWTRSLEPITFDHMYRQGAQQVGVSYTRDVRSKVSRASSE